MSKLLIFQCLLIQCLTLALDAAAESPTLKAVQILTRHGDREANDNFKTNLGRLTDEGKNEMYELGLAIRERYDNFLKTEFDPSEASFISSDVDRTIQSASLTAYGLYEDYNLAATWSGEEHILYEPIPVRTVPAKIDTILQVSKPCPRYNELIEESTRRILGEYIENNKDLLDMYEANTKDSSFRDPAFSMSDVRVIKYTAFHEEMTYKVRHNEPLEDWQKEMLKNPNFVSYRKTLLYAISQPGEEQRLYIGSFMKLFLDDFEKESPTKMKIYTGHDRNLYAFMLALGWYDEKNLQEPPTAAALFLELHADASSPKDVYLKASYRDDPKKEPRALTFPGCGSPCYLSEFKTWAKPLTLEDYDKECGVPSSALASNGQSSASVASTAVVTVLIVLVAASIVFMVLRKRRGYTNI